MTQITCPKCSSVVADTLEYCPRCSYDLAANFYQLKVQGQQALVEAEAHQTQVQQQEKPYVMGRVEKYVAWGFVVLIVISTVIHHWPH